MRSQDLIPNQPLINPNDVSEGTIHRVRNGLYWVSRQIPNQTNREWILYNREISETTENISTAATENTSTAPTENITSIDSSEYDDILSYLNDTDLVRSPDTYSEPRTLTRSYAMSDLNNAINDELSVPRTLTRSYAMNDLNDDINDIDDELSVRSYAMSDLNDVIDDELLLHRTQDDMSFSTHDNYSMDKINYEEDSDEYDTILSNTESIINYKSNILDKCLNESPVTLTNYEETDLNYLFIVHIQNQEGKFIKGSCLLRNEMKDLLKSDLNSFPPSYMMAIYKTPSSDYSGDLLSGLTGKPTGKIIIRLPTNQIYITFGSLKRVLSSPIKQWYALPLYGGKPRRIGNVGGVYGASMNHGQIPGFKIYKLFTYYEIMSNIRVEETPDDFPHTYQHDTMLSLFTLVGDIPLNIFISNIIKELLKTDISKRRIAPLRNYFDKWNKLTGKRKYGNPPDI